MFAFLVLFLIFSGIVESFRLVQDVDQLFDNTNTDKRNHKNNDDGNSINKSFKNISDLITDYTDYGFVTARAAATYMDFNAVNGFESEVLPTQFTNFKMNGADFDASTTVEGYIVLKLGLPFEKHYIQTKDGYILEAHRIPQTSRNHSDPAPVVIVQHGILASSWCYISSKKTALALRLWDAGYDVWLTNSRGNAFGNKHLHLDPNSKQFWDFSFNEMKHDIYANIQTIKQVTGLEKLRYVAHSQGTTAFFIAAQSEYKEFIEKHISVFVALSPVTYLKHETSPLLTALVNFDIADVLHLVFTKSLLDGNQALHVFESFMCKITLGFLCHVVAGLVGGFSPKDDIDDVERLTYHFPSGTSVKSLIHYEQWIKHLRFGQYDYGKDNKKHYGTNTPPSYDLGNVKIPTALFMASGDTLVNPLDATYLINELPFESLIFKKTYQDYSHMTWVVGDETTLSWISDCIGILRKY